jgi:hypothetical protein
MGICIYRYAMSSTKDESMNNSSSTQIPLSLPIYQRLFSQPTQPSTRSEMSAEAQRSSVPNYPQFTQQLPVCPRQPNQPNSTQRTALPPNAFLHPCLQSVGRGRSLLEHSPDAPSLFTLFPRQSAFASHIVCSLLCC